MTPQYGGLICKGGGLILPLTYSAVTVDYNNVFLFFTKFLETGRILSFKRTLWTGQIYLLMEMKENKETSVISYYTK